MNTAYKLGRDRLPARILERTVMNCSLTGPMRNLDYVCLLLHLYIVIAILLYEI